VNAKAIRTTFDLYGRLIPGNEEDAVARIDP
jgi:hypothetical protein